jgi:hypothetical protein
MLLPEGLVAETRELYGYLSQERLLRPSLIALYRRRLSTRSGSAPRINREDHRDQMKRCGQGSSNIRPLPNRKNLLRIDYGKL